MAKLNARILCVDDDPAIRELIAAGLRRFGFMPLACSNATQALRIVESEQIDLCVFEFRLPDINAEHFARELRRLAPRASLVMMSKNGDVSAAALRLVHRFVAKDSWLERSLVAEIFELLGKSCAVA